MDWRIGLALPNSIAPAHGGAGSLAIATIIQTTGVAPCRVTGAPGGGHDSSGFDGAIQRRYGPAFATTKGASLPERLAADGTLIGQNAPVTNGTGMNIPFTGQALQTVGFPLPPERSRSRDGWPDGVRYSPLRSSPRGRRKKKLAGSTTSSSATSCRAPVPPSRGIFSE